MCKISQIPTTVFLVRAIQTVLVSITDVGVVNAAMVRTQEVIRRACCDGGICQRQHSHSVFSHNTLEHLCIFYILDEIFKEVKAVRMVSELRMDSLQLCSSEPSPQSLSPSHSHDLEIHL